MGYISSKLINMSSEIDNSLKSVDNELKTLPQGTISRELQHGKWQFVVRTVEDGKYKRHNISDKDIIIKLIRRRLLEENTITLLHNKKIIDKAIEQIEEQDATKQIFDLKHRLKNDSEELILKALSWNNDEWANEDYDKLQHADYDTKWHVTTFGLKVRSKSEALIAEMLYRYKIPFRYEQLVYIKNISLAPDFTIKRKDGKLIYWEHQGLTNSKEYLDWQTRKSQLYASIGIVPWDNLIVTYDRQDGIIDLRVIESEIVNKLL